MIDFYENCVEFNVINDFKHGDVLLIMLSNSILHVVRVIVTPTETLYSRFDGLGRILPKRIESFIQIEGL